MTSFTQSDDLEGAEFVDVNARGARFTRSDLSKAVMRAVEINGADIDAPWLLEPDNVLLVNGVNVVPLVDAELDRRFPGRSQRKAATPAALRDAWASLEQTWAATLDRVRAMPDGTTDRSVDGEWSFAQTLRHLVMATDTWLGRAIKGVEQPYHPIGQPNIEYETDGNDMTVFATIQPGYDEVLAVRAERMTMVRDYLTHVTEDDLTSTRPNPWAPQYPETVLSCLHTILEEEWEHHRYAVRDLNKL